jgi:hypothetical protein
MMFNVGFGSENRENRIREIAEEDLTVGVILAAVHFEWMMKRAILKLGTSPTPQLRKELENVSRIVSQNVMTVISSLASTISGNAKLISASIIDLRWALFLESSLIFKKGQ